MNSGFVLRVITGPDTGASTSVDVPVVVGREGDLAVCDPTASRRRWRVEPEGDHLHLTDAGSAAGNTVNGRPMQDGQIAAGHVVMFGGSSVRVLRFARYTDTAGGPAVTVRQHGRDRTIAARDGTTIGRDPSCGIRVDDPSVSRNHAVFRISGTGRAGRPTDAQRHDRGRSSAARLRDCLRRARHEVGTAAARLTYTEASTGNGPASVRVAPEASGVRTAVTVDASPESTVAQVTAEFARVLNLPDSQLLMYRNDDGALFHPDDRWSAIGVHPGDEFVVGPGDASAFDAATSRRHARRRSILNQLPRTVWPEAPHVIARIDPPESTSFRGRGIVWQVGGGLGAVVIGLTLAWLHESSP